MYSLSFSVFWNHRFWFDGSLRVEGVVYGDRYTFIRDFHINRREYLVNDGFVDEDFEEDSFEEDVFDDFDMNDPDEYDGE